METGPQTAGECLSRLGQLLMPADAGLVVPHEFLGDATESVQQHPHARQQIHRFDATGSSPPPTCARTPAPSPTPAECRLVHHRAGSMSAETTDHTERAHRRHIRSDRPDPRPDILDGSTRPSPARSMTNAATRSAQRSPSPTSSASQAATLGSVARPLQSTSPAPGAPTSVAQQRPTPTAPCS